AFPFPPLPPLAAIHLWEGSVRSASVSPVCGSFASVPTGTSRTRSSPPRPCLFWPAPFLPGFALKRFRYRKSSRLPFRSEASSTTLPPSPPSPPSGPPRGTYFSRRKPTHPFPPLPATTVIVTSSMNFIGQNTTPLSPLSGGEHIEL